MITADETQFPNNAVALLELRCQLVDPDLFVIKRPLRASDPNQSIGVYAAQWVPNDDSKEMRAVMGGIQPTLSRYNIVIQALVRDTDEVRGLNVHTILARLLRSMLYTDAPLRDSLAQLSSNLGGATERSQRWGISQQRFFANELAGEWLYLSILEFWLETETI